MRNPFSKSWFYEVSLACVGLATVFLLSSGHASMLPSANARCIPQDTEEYEEPGQILARRLTINQIEETMPCNGLSR